MFCNAWFVGFSTRKLAFFNAWFVGFLTRRTCSFSMQPNGFSIRKRMFLRCELFAKRTAYGRVYVLGGML